MALERDEDEYGHRLQLIYSEQVAGLRQQLQAVDRNVLRFISEGRDRSEQIDRMLGALTTCASELTHIRQWQRVVIVAMIVLGVGVAALLVRVF